MKPSAIYNIIRRITLDTYSFGIEKFYNWQYGSTFNIEPMTAEEVGQMLGGN
jgi:hypothetical protein